MPVLQMKDITEDVINSTVSDGPDDQMWGMAAVGAGGVCGTGLCVSGCS